MQLPPQTIAHTADAVRTWLISELAKRARVDERAVDVRERFNRYGLDSMGAAGLLADLASMLGRPVAPTLVWDHPTIESLTRYLVEGKTEPRPLETAAALPSSISEPIAIVGLACRLPKAASVPGYWRLLMGKVDAIVEVPPDRWNTKAFYDLDPAAPGKMTTRWGGFLEHVDQFDPQFFGISPREASQMDPQQRLVMEICWEALEDAGMSPHQLRGTQAGVFFGAMWQDYARLHAGRPDLIVQHTATGHDLSIIPARVSYTLGLQGPCIAVNTACSSSLVAVHLACQSLRAGECDVAIAGGVNLLISPESTVVMSKFGAMAPDGRSKAFDARANGYVRGEGAGAVVLKPLSLALAAGDPIYCVVRGSAVNNDGFSNGLTAPNPQAQEAVLRQAYARAGVEPHRVQFVETHGTGTILGDPIEAKALGAVLSAGRPPERPLRLGSVKTNIGHLEAAAGIAGLIKAALVLKHRTIPPNLHFEQPNPHIPFDQLHLRVPRDPESLRDEQEPAAAGVSSFGFGGTNCHVVLEELRSSSVHCLPLSAGSQEELRSHARALRSFLTEPEPRPRLPELCRAAGNRLSQQAWRLALTVRSEEQLVEQLASFLEERTVPGMAVCRGPATPPRVVFMFAGQGSQWVSMGRDLLGREPVFRDALERCEQAMRPYVDWSLLAELSADKERSRIVMDTDVIQPAVFAVQVALAALWRSWGITPAAVVGQSMGEVAAAHVAGALSLEDAARIICRRSQIVKSAGGQGGMAITELSLEDAQRALAGYEDRLSIAVSTGPSTTVLSGEKGALEEVLAALQGRNVFCRQVKVDYASHSPQMDGLRDELLEALRGIQPRDTTVPFYSTVTGAQIEGVELDEAYWVRNLRDPVLFWPVVALLAEERHDVFLDINPHPLLTHPVEQSLSHLDRQGTVLPSMRREEDGQAVLLESLGVLYALGASVHWQSLYPAEVEPIPLPVPAAPPVDGAAASEPEPARAQVLLLSAQQPAALRDAAQAMASWLAPGNDFRLEDICYTASTRRSHHEHRLAVVGASTEELAASLEAFSRGEAPPGAVQGQRASGPPRGLVFVFPGQGSQWLGMGRQLMKEEPVFRAALKACDRAFRRYCDWSLLERLNAGGDGPQLDRIDVIQPALFAIEVALAALWRSWGVEPDAVVGHSMGEVAAAHVAGALSLDDAARIICRRSQLLLRVSGRGLMAVVELSMEETQQLLEGYEELLSVAASNSPRSTVISGDPTALEEVLWFLEREKIFCRRVKVDVASHSPQMDPLREDLLEALSTLHPRASAVPIHSTVLGEPISGAELTAEYWVKNLRAPVLLSPAVQRLIETGHELFLEISPHPILLSAVEEGLRHAERTGAALPSLRRAQAERRVLLDSAAALHVQGRGVDWKRLHASGGRCVPLPTYPWQRARHWIQDEGHGKLVPSTSNGEAEHPLLGARFAVAAHPGSHFWQNTLSARLQPYLADHRVQGEVVLPGAAYIEMALSAAGEALGDTTYLLEDVAFERVLALPEDGARAVQLALVKEGSGATSFHVSSLQDGAEGAWLRHASGTLRPSELGASAEPARIDVEALRAELQAATSGDEHYKAMEELGLGYGARFQGVQRLWHGQGQALAEVRLPARVASQRQAYRVHPALLDSCFQVLIGLIVASQAQGAVKGTHVLVGVDRMQLYRQVDDEVLVHGRLRHGETARGAMLVGDLSLLDQQGTVVAEISGAWVKALEPETHAQLPEEDLLYGISWRRGADAPAAPAADGSSRGGAWLILADRNGTGDALASHLRARGEACVLVVADEQYRQIEPGLFQVNPADPASFRALLEGAFGEKPRCRGVLHLWSLDATPTPALSRAALQADQQLGSVSIVHLVQALFQQGWRDTPRLWLVTRGAQAVAGEAELSPAQAPVWGLGRVLALEHPELRCTLLDLGLSRTSEDAEALLREILLDDKEDQIALRQDGRHLARLVRASFKDAESRAALAPARGRPFRLEVATPGVLDSLTMVAAERRPPGPGEVEIEVYAAGLSFNDALEALGDRPGQGEGPVLLGGECSGRVTRTGEGVDGLREGDEVVAAVPGCLGSHVTAPASFVVSKPAHLSFEEAAAVPIAFMVAHHALRRRAELHRGERALIHAASGGVGQAAVQVARALGAEVLATAGSSEKMSHLRSMGVEHVWSSRSASFAAAVMEATKGRGVDVVLSSAAGDVAAKSLECLAPHGRFLDINKRDLHSRRLNLSSAPRNSSYAAIDLAAMAKDRPDQFAALLREVMGLFEASTLKPLPITTFRASEIKDAFQRMADAKHVGKVVVSMRDPDVRIAPAPRSDVRVRADGTYLITGGLGDLGLSVARWLVGQGARHVALVGRRRPSEAAQAAIKDLEAAGAEVATFQADVAELEQVAEVLRHVERHLPPLRGVVHAAGLLDARTVLQLDADRFFRVMGPKVYGAWNLHALTADKPLDFFVLYSSATSLIGSPGEGNYAAANAFMDVLAHQRQATGLPALSINWGIFSVGMATAKENLSDRLSSRGMGSLDPAQGVEVLGRLLSRAIPQVGVIKLNVRQWLEFYPNAARSPFWAELRSEEQGRSAQAPGRALSIHELVQDAEPQERAGLVEQRLRDIVGRVLRLEPSRIDRMTAFGNLGLDSLMSLELRNRLESELGLKLTATLLYTYPNLASLTSFILNKAGVASVQGNGDSQGKTSDRNGKAKGDMREDLSVKDAEALLEAKLTSMEQRMRGVL
ncbi:SDR family NAD(P)-dependent oxidoreductase [Sorangium sp. So ce216]